MSNTCFDSQFQSIPFYQSHWYMLPFVGDNYESPKHKKLLLIGESHYMPEGATLHHDVDRWYDEVPNLSHEEERWCDTRGTREWKSGQFGKNIDSAIRRIFQVESDNAFQEMASYNYFLRPADSKKSFKDICTERDCMEAVRMFGILLDILKPDLIVFVSKFAFDYAEWIDFPKVFNCRLWDYTAKNNMDYIFTEHPSSSWWNRVVKMKTGSSDDYFRGMTSRDFFCTWLKENWIR